MRKGPVTNVTDTTLVLVSRGTNRGNPWYPKNPRMTLSKEGQPTVKGIQ